MRRGAGGGRLPALTRPATARVVPDLPSFAVDDGFAYAVPEHLADDIQIGSIVRVPLSGRKVRGFVTDLAAEAAGDLKEITSITGAWPLFSADTLRTLRWAAGHYVAPLSVVLGKTAPPNLPRRAAERTLPSVPNAASPLSQASVVAAAGGHHRPQLLLAGTAWPELVRRIVTPPVREGRSVLVVAPTVIETMQLADALGGDLGARIVEVADQSDATVTTAWSLAAAQPGLVVIGTPRVVWWPVRDLSMIVTIEEGRRAMKERQTPAVSVREVARRRSSVERFPLVSIGRHPTVDAISDGTEQVRVPGRLWPLVEVVDRREEPPGGGIVTQRVRQAVAGALRRHQRVFVFTHRRGYAPASRCASCRELRTCAQCGSRPDPGPECRRCGATLGACRSCGGRRFEPLGAAIGRVIEELRRVAGDDVGERHADTRVTVGTERDLVGAPAVSLAVAIDADGLVRGTNYRAGEDALAVLTRVAALVGDDDGSRMMVQTADPGHAIFTALKRGDPGPYLAEELASRQALALPPAGEVIVLEIAGLDDPDELSDVFGTATVFGPAEAGDRLRWLIQGEDLTDVRTRLRSAVGKLRERGVRVRIDVDPRDL